MTATEDFEAKAVILIAEIQKRPELHMHSSSNELMECCTIDGIIMLDVKSAHGEIGCPATLDSSL